WCAGEAAVGLEELERRRVAQVEYFQRLLAGVAFAAAVGVQFGHAPPVGMLERLGRAGRVDPELAVQGEEVDLRAHARRQRFRRDRTCRTGAASKIGRASCRARESVS